MTRRIDITLISPVSRSFSHFHPPLALIYLAGYLRHCGLNPQIIDITQNHVVKDQRFYQNYQSAFRLLDQKLITKIRRSASPIFGISCYTSEYQEVLSLARRIKKIHRHATIVVGGIHPTLYPQELLLEKNSPVDFEVIGEGEETLCELVTTLRQKTNHFSSIKGIAYIDQKTGDFIQTPPRPINDNLDQISFPAYDLVDMEYYSHASPYAIRGCYLRSVHLLATRGCPSSCTFCVAKKLRQFHLGEKWTRSRSATSLVSEIEFLTQKYHLDSFYFADDLFTLDRQNVNDFCRLLIQKKLNLFWGCSSKVSTLNTDLIKIMAESGCVQIDFGVERGSDHALRQIQKGISVDLVAKIFRLCRQYRIRTFANFLVNLPGETKKDLHDICTLAKRLHSDVVSMNIFTLFPGTEIYDQFQNRFSKKDYQDLSRAADLLQQYPEKYRFAAHKINLLAWVNRQNRKFNHFLPALSFHLRPKYLQKILTSPRLDDYLRQFINLLKEFINQKFPQ